MAITKINIINLPKDFSFCVSFWTSFSCIPLHYLQTSENYCGCDVLFFLIFLLLIRSYSTNDISYSSLTSSTFSIWNDDGCKILPFHVENPIKKQDHKNSLITYQSINCKKYLKNSEKWWKVESRSYSLNVS